MLAPDDMDTISEAELITGYHVEPVVSLPGGIDAALDRGFDDRVVARQTVVDMKMADLEAAEQAIDEELTADVVVEEDQAPVVRLVRAILMGAINANTSDIHLEPHQPEMRVRYRVDGAAAVGHDDSAAHRRGGRRPHQGHGRRWTRPKTAGRRTGSSAFTKPARG